MFQCTKCTKSFPTRNTLTQHNYYTHCEKRKLKSLCKICGKQMSTITALKIHIRSVHEGTEVACEICDKLFTCKSSLIAHRKEQHASKKSFKCKSCDLIFWKEHQRAKHEKEAHTNTEIVCEFCDSEFMSKKALSKHIKYVHESRDKLKCPICSSEISRAHSLTEHIKSIHDGCTFECDRCCIFFSRKFNIRSHMEMYDSDYEPKPCKECGRLCFTEHSLKFHIKAYAIIADAISTILPSSVERIYSITCQLNNLRTISQLTRRRLFPDPFRMQCNCHTRSFQKPYHYRGKLPN